MNEWVLEQVGRHWRVLNFVDKLKLQYFGHTTRRRNLENDMVTGTVYGKKGRGRCRTRWSNGVKLSLGCSFIEALRKAQYCQEYQKIRAQTTDSPMSSSWDDDDDITSNSFF